MSQYFGPFIFHHILQWVFLETSIVLRFLVLKSLTFWDFDFPRSLYALSKQGTLLQVAVKLLLANSSYVWLLLQHPHQKYHFTIFNFVRQTAFAEIYPESQSDKANIFCQFHLSAIFLFLAISLPRYWPWGHLQCYWSHITKSILTQKTNTPRNLEKYMLPHFLPNFPAWVLAPPPHSSPRPPAIHLH